MFSFPLSSFYFCGCLHWRTARGHGLSQCAHTYVPPPPFPRQELGLHQHPGSLPPTRLPQSHPSPPTVNAALKPKLLDPRRLFGGFIYMESFHVFYSVSGVFTDMMLLRCTHVLQVALAYSHCWSSYIWGTLHNSSVLSMHISSVSSIRILQILVPVLWYTTYMNFFCMST